MRKGSSLSKIIADSDVQVAPRKSLREDTADALRELILLEKLPPGTSIPERDLAEAMGISRTPMREAMRMLESEGLIEYMASAVFKVIPLVDGKNRLAWFAKTFLRLPEVSPVNPLNPFCHS